MPQNNMARSMKIPLVLKAVKKIVIEFCPFEPNVRSTREFLTVVGSMKVRSTNVNCEMTTTVKHDKSEPVIDVIYVDGDRLIMKGAHLTSQEMLSAFQSRCIQKELGSAPAK